MSTPEMPATSTPPPHPYAAGQRPGGDQGLPITTMALGLLALLTTLVGVFYAGIIVVVGIGIAVVALVLGVLAILRKQHPRSLTFVGIAAAALSVLAALLVWVLTLAGVVGSSTDSDTYADGGNGNQVPQPIEQIDAEWPSNMATGSIIFLGGSADGGEVVRSEAPPSGSAPFNPLVSASGESGPVNRIQLYVDYMCPVCGVFEETNAATIESALEGGDTSFELRPLTFLDEASNGSYYSSRASGALACVVNTQPDLAWKTHTTLLDPKNQPQEYTAGPTNEQLITLLNTATGGLSQQTQSCITAESYVPFAQGLSKWLLTNPVPNAADPLLMVSGTPTAVVNGERYEGSISDAAAFKSFLQKQGITLK